MCKSSYPNPIMIEYCCKYPTEDTNEKKALHVKGAVSSDIERLTKSEQLTAFPAVVCCVCGAHEVITRASAFNVIIPQNELPERRYV